MRGFGKFGCRLQTTFSTAMVHVDELLRLRNVANDVELLDLLFLGDFKRRRCGRKSFAFAGILGPLAGGGEILERFRVFDENIHELPA